MATSLAESSWRNSTIEPHTLARLGIGVLVCIGFLAGMLVDQSPDQLAPGEPVPETAHLLLPLLANNAATGSLLVLGGFTFGVLTVVTAAWSGFVWGLFFSGFERSAGLGAALALGVPHGLFEIGWIVLLGGLGVELGRLLAHTMTTGSIEPLLAEVESTNLWTTIATGFLLVLLGALVEAYLTMPIARSLVSF